MALISCYQLKKAFAGKTLFQDVSFGIDEKQKIGLVGPNGAGKSTLIKILMGKMEPDSGKVTPQRGLRMGYMEQTPEFAEDDTIMTALLSKCDDPWDSMSKAYEWIAKLDLTQFGEDFPVAKLSGGWKKRVALARELVLEPEVLLLDEPTNHLDVKSILWLEEFLKNASFSILMITHDRLFLQRVVNKVLDLDPKNPNSLLSVNGDYLQYIESKEQILAGQLQRENVLKNTLRRETEWLRRGAQARQTKQKARIQNAGTLKDDVQNLSAKNAIREVGIDFGETERSPQKLIKAIGVSKTFSGEKLFGPLDLLVSPKTRLALLGENGCGKSTLIRILLGLEKSDTGRVERADQLKVSYFEQSRETLKTDLSVLRNICPDGDYVSYRGEFIYAKSYLEKFLFFGQQCELPVGRLSGGEQARLRIAQLMLQEAQVLVLDEPTNDLDVATLTVLEAALKDFPGAVILVSHDRYFMDSVAKQIMAFHVATDGRRSLETFTGYLQWEEWYEAQMQIPAVTASAETSSGNKDKIKGKLTFNEKFEYENIEAEIAKTESTLESKKIEAESPAILSDAQGLVKIHTEMTDLQNQLDHMYSRWSELENKAHGRSQ